MVQRIFLLIFISFVCLVNANGQGFGDAKLEILKKMQEKGVSQTELEAKLKEKGYKPESFDMTNPVEANNARIKVLDAVDEVAADKAKVADAEKAKTAEAAKATAQPTQQPPGQQQPTQQQPVQQQPTGMPATQQPGQTVTQQPGQLPANGVIKKEDATQGAVNKEDLQNVIIDKPKGLEELEKGAVQTNTGEIQQAVAEGATFEEAVSEQVSQELVEKLPPAKTWGQQIFRDKKIATYQQSRDSKPPDSYVLGPGDRIAVSIWGYSQENVIFEINEDGYIKPEAMPRIYLKGISMGKAKALIESRFHNYYRFRPEEFEVALNFSRVITVNIVGEVFNYGSFVLPARNTAFNALAAAGGPTDIGSVRNIKLIRAQQEAVNIDIYKFLLNPSAEEKLFLQENDYIYVPMVDRLVVIKGSVRRHGRYELIKGENLSKLVEYAAGLTVNAYTDNVVVLRTVNGKETYLDVNLTDILQGKGDFELLNEDVVTIQSLNRPYQNTVKIVGTVEVEGEFQLIDSMRVSDLINKSILKKEASREFAMLMRKKDDGTNEIEKLQLDSILAKPGGDNDFLLKPSDEITIYPMSRFVDDATVKVEGAVRTPRVFPYDFSKSFTVENMISLAGGLQKDALETGYILRRDFIDATKKQYIKINVKNAIENPESSDNLLLQPYDNLVVYSQNEFSDPEFSVSITGAVKNGGFYPYGPGLKVSDLIYFSKGLDLAAEDFGYIERFDPTTPGYKKYIRVNVKTAFEHPDSTENILMEPKDKLVVYSKKDFRTQFGDFNVSATGAVVTGGTYPYGPGLKVSDLIYFSKGLEYSAADIGYITRTDMFNPGFRKYIRVDVKKAYENPGSTEDILIEPDDKLIVYNKKDFTNEFEVGITGAVKSTESVPFEPGLRVSDLVYFAKGFDLTAADFGYIHRVDPYNPGFREYIRVNVKNAYENPNSPDNISLAPRDKLTVYSKGMFIDETFAVQVKGLVRNPGEFKIGKGLTLRDALTMAGGLRFEAAKSRIEVYRLLINDNKETETVVATFSVDANLNVISGSNRTVELQEFDQIYVRQVPDFNVQQGITINGEVFYPGTYPLIRKNEKLLDVLRRSGGLTTEAFPAGARLYRSNPQEKGYVILDLHKLLRKRFRRSKSIYNYIMKPGDEIRIPKKRDLVTLATPNTNVADLMSADLIVDGVLHVAYIKGKRANYYVKEFLAGNNANGSKKKITVLRPNGRLSKTKDFFIFKIYPKVTKGSIIKVGMKKPPTPDKPEQQQIEAPKVPINWGEFLRETLATTTATLTFLLLLRELNK